MDNVVIKQIQNDSLMHYASKYYDPQKAHEYYEAHKKLVGRHSTKDFSEEGKIAWQYAKKQMNNEKKEKNKSISEDYKAKVAGYRTISKEAKERISAELKDKLASISDEKERKAVALSLKGALENARIYSAAGVMKEQEKETANNRIEQLQSQIKNSSSELASLSMRSLIADIRESRDETLSDISEETSEKHQEVTQNTSESKEDISDDTASRKLAARMQAADDKKQVTETMKQSIEQARSDMKNQKESLKRTYETLFDTEYNAIANEYGTGSSQIDPELQAKMEAKAETRRKALREKWAAKSKKKV